ncbi:uncharacterized protein LOC133198991 [Saccostrea echinata]|uniref:uncharacterized protein LOC133198991 n=1 Tax=Saccostrea echinata TaxID=191078 RepID=UPI002A83D2A7|nr:uncharacterized protein LOC133198991 [Saccostrea echinata]
MITHLCLVLGLALSTTAATDPACPLWKQYVDTFNAGSGRQPVRDGGVRFMCKYHPEKCEQLDCEGRFSNALTGTFQYCLNMVMNHCDKPINMDVSISVDKFNFNFAKRVAHNTRFPLALKNQSFSLSGIPLREYLEFTLVKLNATAVRIGMKLSTELCIPNLGCTFNKKITLIPDNIVPVSRCNKTTKTPLPKAPKCGKGKTGGGGVPFTTTTMPPHTTYKSASFGKNCSMTDIMNNPCGRNEVCKQGRCACFTPRYPLCQYSNLCQTEESCAKHIVPPLEFGPSSPHKSPRNNSSGGPTDKTALIVGGTLGGIIFIVIIAGIILVMLKKRGANYRGRQLLLTEDDTDGII